MKKIPLFFFIIQLKFSFGMHHGQTSGQGNDLNPPEKLQYSLDSQGNPIIYLLGNPIQVAGNLSPQEINLIQEDYRLRAKLDELKRQHDNLDFSMRQGNEQTQLAFIKRLRVIKKSLNPSEGGEFYFLFCLE